MSYRPVLVSEREAAHTWPNGQQDDSHWEDCAWTSALMLANATTGGRFPATLPEAEAARATVMGPLGGTTITQLVTGTHNRWQLVAARLNADIYTFDAFWAALTPGKGAVAMGKLAGLPYGHRLRRWQPDYAGGHAVYVQREAAEDRVWWMDPLSTTGYPGEYATKAELAAYYNAFRVYGAGSLVAPVFAIPAPAPQYTLSRVERLPDGTRFDCRGTVNVWDPLRPGSPVGTISGSTAIRWRAEIDWPSANIPQGYPFDQISEPGGYFNCWVFEGDGEVLLPVPQTPPVPPVVEQPPIVLPPAPEPTPEPMPDPIPTPIPTVPRTARKPERGPRQGRYGRIKDI